MKFLNVMGSANRPPEVVEDSLGLFYILLDYLKSPKFWAVWTPGDYLRQLIK